MNLEGVLPIWKPVDFTSHDVVAKARRILGIKRIGHTGTLDPKVTGVLPLCIGRATRLVEYIQEMPKEYRAKLIVGISTDTEDMTGVILEQAEHVVLKEDTVREAIRSFVGEIEQVPPMYSAVKMDGKRLYELARQGEVVERKARKAVIYRIDMIQMNLELPRPEIEFVVECSKGTYIRTLCADIGKALGYPAVMAELVRTATGGMTREQCFTLEELAEAKSRGTEELLKLLVPSDRAVSFLPSVTLSGKLAVHALQGKKLALQGEPPFQATHSPLSEGMKGLGRAYGPDGQFLGLFRWMEEERVLVPEKVFVPESL